MQANAMQSKGIEEPAGVMNCSRLFEREARPFGSKSIQRARVCERGILSESGARSSRFSTWQSHPGVRAMKGRCGRSASHIERRYSWASHQTQHLLGAHGKADITLYALH